jgi:hypothetical protein
VVPAGIREFNSFIAFLPLFIALVSALAASLLLCRANSAVRPLMQAWTSSLSVDRRAPLLSMRRSSRPPRTQKWSVGRAVQIKTGEAVSLTEA